MCLPLKNITILDLTHVLAGPYATRRLGMMGATIIKIERPGIGDDTRAFPPFINEESVYFSSLNSGKYSIALDLKLPNDRAHFEQLLERADVLVENFRPGTMARLGYSADDLTKAYPNLIFASVSGFGQTGPDCLQPAYDMVVQARGGIMSITGEYGREPVRVGASVGDIIAGMFLLEGILTALYQRTTTGRAERVDVSMLDSQLAILEHAVAMVSATDTAPSPSGARHPTITPFDTFHASDGLFVIACGNDHLFAQLCRALDLGDLIHDPRFDSNASRCENERLLKRYIEQKTLSAPRDHWINLLKQNGLPTAAIQNVAEAMQDPQILAREMVQTIPSWTQGLTHKVAGNPVKIGSQPASPDFCAAPKLDQDREKILGWINGQNTL
jgi:CoA:oxalate CoA-transferase